MVRDHPIEGLLRARRQADDAVPLAHVEVGPRLPAKDDRAEAKLLVAKDLADVEGDAVARRFRVALVQVGRQVVAHLEQRAHRRVTPPQLQRAAAGGVPATEGRTGATEWCDAAALLVVGVLALLVLLLVAAVLLVIVRVRREQRGARPGLVRCCHRRRVRWLALAQRLVALAKQLPQVGEHVTPWAESLPRGSCHLARRLGRRQHDEAARRASARPRPLRRHQGSFAGAASAGKAAGASVESAAAAEEARARAASMARQRRRRAAHRRRHRLRRRQQRSARVRRRAAVADERARVLPCEVGGGSHRPTTGSKRPKRAGLSRGCEIRRWFNGSRSRFSCATYRTSAPAPEVLDAVAQVRQHPVEGLLRTRRQADDAVPLAHVDLRPPVPSDHHRPKAKSLVPEHLTDAELDSLPVRIGNALVNELLEVALELAEGAHCAETIVEPLLHRAFVRLGRALLPHCSH